MRELNAHDEAGRDLSPPGPGAAFLLVPPAMLPARWRDRAVDYYAVWLDAHELADLDPSDDRLPDDLRAVAPLVVAGYSANAIADRLFLSPRTVHRRLRRLRHRLGAATHAELVALLARHHELLAKPD